MGASEAVVRAAKVAATAGFPITELRGARYAGVRQRSEACGLSESHSRRARRGSLQALFLVAAALGAILLSDGSAGTYRDATASAIEAPPVATESPAAARPTPPPAPPRPAFPAVRWRESTAVGEPGAGSLLRGVRLPALGRDFRTWDPIERRSPSRSWRRYATDDLVRMVLRVARRYAVADPRALPMLVGDMSRPRGGDFGPQYGFVGHSTHQNGLDADVYYPRLDRRERPPRLPEQVDRRLAQDLVDRFVRAGAEKVFVGLNVRLAGPPGVVAPLPYHDNHLHVRFPNLRR